MESAEYLHLGPDLRMFDRVSALLSIDAISFLMLQFVDWFVKKTSYTQTVKTPTCQFSDAH